MPIDAQSSDCSDIGLCDPPSPVTRDARNRDDGADFWSRPKSGLFADLRSGPNGLTADEASDRLRTMGANEVGARERRRLLTDLMRRIANPLLLLLIAASAIAGATGDIVSFAIIVAIILISTTLDMVQERRAEATAEALRRSIALTASVVRDGAIIQVPVRDVVPGDVVHLSAGDLVPADGLVLEANHPQVNESLLTGEPYPVEKLATDLAGDDATPANALFQGTSLLGGTATMLVVHTARATRFGRIATSLGGTQPPTAFEHGIHRLGMLIVRLTIFLVLFVLLAQLALGRPPVQSFMFAMALAVGLTPELLPMIMTVALARGAQRMAAARVVVKRLSAIHDLGQMDVLCTDKTGTLTEAHMALVAHPGIDGDDDERVADLAAVNARFETGLRSPLDEALLLHTETRSLDSWRKLDERPFDFERRRVSVLAERDGERIEIVKGAPEALLMLCTRVQQRDGTLVAMDDDLRRQVTALHDARAAQGLRLLAVAWKPADGQLKIRPDGEEELVFVGYCAFVDPSKASAGLAVAALGRQGVRVKILSGDAPQVVAHLVQRLALPPAEMLTGDEIAQLDDAGLTARVDEVDLFARVTPDQKTRIVRALMARGHCVGFMGDGINDAPAIRAADVGLSVEGATDVAREAADMILLEADLAVLGAGVAEGRRTYANIMKYLRMGTSSNFGNMLTMAIASLVLPFLPLTALQLLLNNLIYDMSQIGIPFDRADARDLVRPHGWDMAALTRFTLLMGPLSSLFDGLTFAVLLWWLHTGVAEFRTLWFVESMATQILVIFVIRTARPAWRDRPTRILTSTALGGLLVAMLLPIVPGASLLGFAMPDPRGLCAILALVVVYLVVTEFVKRWAINSEAEPSPTNAFIHPNGLRGV